MTTTAKLTGPELLEKLKELGDVSKTEQVQACGYVTTKKDGTERLNFTAFYKALLDAKGVRTGREDGAVDGRKALPFIATVGSSSGSLVIGSRYIEMAGLGKGDQMKIQVTRRGITLLPIKDQEKGDELVAAG